MHNQKEIFNLTVKAQEKTSGWPGQIKAAQDDSDIMNLASQAWDDGIVNMAFATLNRGNPSLETLAVIESEMNTILGKKR